jgi:hypothetical protein
MSRVETTCERYEDEPVIEDSDDEKEFVRQHSQHFTVVVSRVDF